MNENKLQATHQNTLSSMAIAAVDMESLAAEVAAAPYTALVDNNGIVTGPASWYQTLQGFGHLEDKLFHNKNSTLLGNGKKDIKHQDVSGYYVVCDAGEVMLFDNCIDARAWASSKYYVNEVFAPSLSFVMIDEEKLAVVKKEDLVKLILRYPKMKPLPPHVTAHAATSAPVGRMHVVRAGQAPGSSLVLPAGCFVVPSKNYSMYGKRMRDVHMARYSIESDEIIRFRKRDDKAEVTGLLVGVGRFSRTDNAQDFMIKLIDRNDEMLKDLESIEVDKTLTNMVSNYFLNQNI